MADVPAETESGKEGHSHQSAWAMPVKDCHWKCGLSTKAKAILDTEDIQLPTGELLEVQVIKHAKRISKLKGQLQLQSFPH
jgi:hypothetical protein